MCIIIYKPKGVSIPEDALKRCWDGNTQGAGFVQAKDGSLILQKGFFKYDMFLNHYKESEDPTVPALIHFRISTGGEIDTPNCHPFLVNKDLAFMHNGMMRTYDYKDSKYSDTVHFNRDMLKKLPSGFTMNDAITRLLALHIGCGNKLAFIASDGDVTIINEDAGTWHEGAWYSNGGFKHYNYNRRGSYQGSYDRNYKTTYWLCPTCNYTTSTVRFQSCEKCLRAIANGNTVGDIRKT